MVLEITQLSPNSVQITLEFVDQASPDLGQPTKEIGSKIYLVLMVPPSFLHQFSLLPP